MKEYEALPESQGARANYNGALFDREVHASIKALGYTFLPKVHHIESVKARTGHLFAETGCFAAEVRVPLSAPYHSGRQLEAVVDKLIYTPSGEFVVLSIKSQQSGGSCDEKLEFEFHQLVATELPAALLVCGPLKGRDGPGGWSAKVLLPFWDRIFHFGERRVYPFRSNIKMCQWIKAGLPVAGKGVSHSCIVNEFCDREP